MLHPEPFEIFENDSPIVTVAVHHGHDMRPEIESRCALGDRARLREEDPYTGEIATVSDTRSIVHRSRFEVDLNRPRQNAVYRQPQDAWGLEVWNRPLSEGIVRRSLDIYDEYYDRLYDLLSHLIQIHDRVVVLDLHSYNFRRSGPHAAPAQPVQNPEINIGTGSVDHQQWGDLVERFIEDLRSHNFLGRHLDVRENVKFQGGELSRRLNADFPLHLCTIAVEFKKFWMNEWTGQCDRRQLQELRATLQDTLAGLRHSLDRAEVKV